MGVGFSSWYEVLPRSAEALIGFLGNVGASLGLGLFVGGWGGIGFGALFGAIVALRHHDHAA